MSYPGFVGGTAATIVDNNPPATTLAYPSGVSANDLVLVGASWADRTYWGPGRLLGDGDPHGFEYSASATHQSTQSVRDTTRLGPNLPMAYRPADDVGALLGHFISFRLWAFRDAGTVQFYDGGNIVTDGARDSYLFNVAALGSPGAAAADTAVVFGLAVTPLTRDVIPPTPFQPGFALARWSPADVVSLNEIGAGEPLGHAAWLGHIPAEAGLAIAYDVLVTGCAGNATELQSYAYFIDYRLDVDAPPIGECPPRQAAAPGATTLRVRASA